MKVINVKGSGKAETAGRIMEELVRRGYTAGSIVEDDREVTVGSGAVSRERPGADPVAAAGRCGTQVNFSRPMDTESIIDMYDVDYVVVEGGCSANCPRIATGRTEEEVREQTDDLTLCVSMSGWDGGDSCCGYPAFDALTGTEALVDLIEERTPDRLPNYSEKCCRACGWGCRGMAARVIRGEESISRCVLRGKEVQVAIDGRELPMVPFVKNIVRSVGTSLIKELDGYREGCEITIRIRG